MRQREMPNMEEELVKLRTYPRWRTIGVVDTIEQANTKLFLLRQSCLRARKMPIQNNHLLVGYRIQIME